MGTLGLPPSKRLDLPKLVLSLTMSSSQALFSALILCLTSPAWATLENRCSDISFYDVVKYTTQEPKNCCDTILRQVCRSKSDNICEDVLELKCDVIAWAECKSEPKTPPGNICIVDVKTKTKHTKQVPDCK